MMITLAIGVWRMGKRLARRIGNIEYRLRDLGVEKRGDTPTACVKQRSLKGG